MKKVEVTKGLFVPAEKVFAVDVFENKKEQGGTEVKVCVKLDSFKNNNFYSGVLKNKAEGKEFVKKNFPEFAEYASDRYVNVGRVVGQRVFEKDGKTKVCISVDLREREDDVLFSDEFVSDDLTQQGAKDAATKANEYIQGL